MKDEMRREAERHPEILSEAIQVTLRRAGVEDALRVVQKALERDLGEAVRLLEERSIPSDLKRRIQEIKPTEYLGEAKRLTDLLIRETRRFLSKS